MSAQTTQKRVRLEAQYGDAAQTGRTEEEQDGGEGGERQRDKKCWFEDGNVILVARNVEFRVFRGILAHHSPVFNDMFSLPQPPEAATGPCPVVHVTDTPEDLRHLLRVYVPMTGSSPFVPDDPSFDLISATIRLGHKYQISKLVEHPVGYLKLYYTDDYAVFSKRGRSYWPPSFKAEHAIGVVNLARLTEEPTLLPVAFLICCTLGKDIVKGFQREDGSWEQLSPDDLGICIDGGRELVARRAEAAIDTFDRPTSEACKQRGICEGILLDMIRFLRADALSCPDPFHSVVRADSNRLQESLCSACWAMLQDEDEDECERVWTFLPMFFGLEEY